MDLAAKQAELDALVWYHEFDFGNGLRTRTPSEHLGEHRRIWRFIGGHLDGIDFRGKSVLDIGAWDGYWSFDAERRGAAAVLAADDLGQNWSAGRGIHLARELLGSKVEIDQNLSVYDLAARGRTFDVILFLGVYYHLHDPFHALAQIRHCCHPGTVVVIDGPVATGLDPNAALYDLSNRCCEWLPTAGALEQLLSTTYFTAAVEGELLPPAPPPAPPAPSSLPPPTPAPGRLGWRWRLDMCRAALAGSRAGMSERLARVLPAPVPPPPPALPPRRPHENKRVLITARPFAGVREHYLYRPPFGLHRYDPRFCDDGATAATESYFRRQLYRDQPARDAA